jgi:hypothetical protein
MAAKAPSEVGSGLRLSSVRNASFYNGRMSIDPEELVRALTDKSAHEVRNEF